MWSGPPSGNGNGNSSQWNQWSFNPNNYTHLAPDQVDWAALAQQWIQMKETQPHPPQSQQQFSEHPMYISAPPFPGPAVTQPAPTPGFHLENHTVPQPDPWTVAIQQQQQPPILDTPVKEEWSNSSESFPQMDYGFQGTFPQPSQHHHPHNNHHHHHHHHHSEESGNYWSNNQQSSGPQVASTKKLAAHLKNEFNRPHQHQHHQHHHEHDTSRTTHELDAIRRKSLPAWIREGLEKVEREKRKKQEKDEQESLKAQLLEVEKAKIAEEAALENNVRTKWALPEPNDIVHGDDEKDETVEKVADRPETLNERINSFLAYINKDENFDQLMLCVRRQLTTILLDGTNEMMSVIAQDMMDKYKRKALQVKKSKAVASLKSELGGFGLTSYGGSDSEESDDSDSDSGGKDSNSDSDTETELLDEIETRKQKFYYEQQLRVLGSEKRSPEPADVHKTDNVKETSGDNNKVHEKEPSSSPSDEEYAEDRESLVDRRSDSTDVNRDNIKNVSKSPSSSSRERNISRSPSRSRSRSDSHDRTKRAKKSRSKSRERKNSSKVPRSRSRNRKRSKKSKSRSKSREKRRSKERRSKSRERKRSKRSRSNSRDRRRSKRSRSKSVDRKKSRKSKSRSSSRSRKRHGKKSKSRSRERRVSKRSRSCSRDRRRAKKSNSRSKSRERRISKRSRSSSKSRSDRRKNSKKSKSRSRSRERQREHKSLKSSKSRDRKKSRKSRSRSESSERKSKYDTN